MNRFIKRFFSKLSLQAKQRLVIISTAVICILFSSTIFFFNDYITTRNHFERDYKVLMDLININSIAPLYFEDPGAAEEILSSLKASADTISAAALYTPDGDLFAEYQRSGKNGSNATMDPIPDLKADIPEDDKRVQVSEVRFKGEVIGYLYFFVDLTRYNRLLLWYGAMTLVTAMVSILIAVFMASYLKRLVIGPVFHLLKKVKKISVDKDFSVRARTFYEDEIGELISGFNEMIEKIQRRDTALEQHRRTLEKNVAERTSDLVKANSELTRLNDDLMVAKQRAEDANSAKSDFLASMSHELRTPLNGILGYTQLFKKFDANLSPEEKERMDVIQNCGEHLLEMINDILDLSKVEAGKMEIHPRSFPLYDFLEATAAIARSKAQEKGLEVVCQLPDDIQVYVTGDDQRIRQVLLNLLSNAVKFTDQGYILLQAEQLKNGVIRFAVEDTGAGISESFLPVIFQSFTQIGDIQHKSEGTGLGLAISRKLVNLMGGELKVKSQVGKGSCFWFDLPLVQSGNNAAGEKKDLDFNAITGYRRLDGKTGPAKVLIVDDVQDNRSLLVDFLGALGFETAEATNGREAVDLCQNRRFDLVLIDIVMPVMGGIEAIQKILAQAGEEPPVIMAISASTNTRMAAGCSRFIVKPIHLDELLKSIETDLKLVWEKQKPETESPALTIDDLSDEQRSTLRDMASDGDISAILDWCMNASGQEPRYDAAIKKVEKLARQFKVNEIKRLVTMANKGE